MLKHIQILFEIKLFTNEMIVYYKFSQKCQYSKKKCNQIPMKNLSRDYYFIALSFRLTIYI